MWSIFLQSQVRFTLLWILATLGGFFLSLLFVEVGEKPDINSIQAALGGLAIALPQSLIFRQPVFSVKWIFLTLIAWAVITAIGVGAIGWFVPTSVYLRHRIIFGTLYGAIGGFIIGLAQWVTIRQLVPQAWQWVLVSCASWAVAVPIGSTVGMFLRHLTGLFLGELVGLAITWLIVATLTGISAYRFLRRVAISTSK